METKNAKKNGAAHASILRVAIVLLLAGLFNSCSKDDNEGKYFYYYFDQKIFLQQQKDVIFIKFSPGTTREQYLALINSEASLPVRERKFFEHGMENYALLESKTGGDIATSTIDFFKANAMIVSVSYLYQDPDNNSFRQALTDEFVVKLKESTSLEYLRDLSLKNNCSVGEENEFVEKQYKLYAPKTANAMLMANKFHETGAFEFAEPNMFVFNNWNKN